MNFCLFIAKRMPSASLMKRFADRSCANLSRRLPYSSIYRQPCDKCAQALPLAPSREISAWLLKLSCNSVSNLRIAARTLDLAITFRHSGTSTSALKGYVLLAVVRRLHPGAYLQALGHLCAPSRQRTVIWITRCRLSLRRGATARSARR
jgi:hypothetical protein